MSPVIRLRVESIELPHPARQIGLRRFDQEMIVIVHQTIRMTQPAEPIHHMRDDGQETAPVGVVDNDRLPGIAATGNVIDRTLKLEAERTRHEAEAAESDMSLQDLTLNAHNRRSVVARKQPWSVMARSVCMASLLRSNSAQSRRHSRAHPARIDLAKALGATDVVSERGEEAVKHERKLTGSFGVHSILECVGTAEAMATAVGITRPGEAIDRVGVPHYDAIPSSDLAFFNNITVGGGPAPVRAYIQELLPDVLEGRIDPGRVFDRIIGLTDVPDGYRAMDERKVIKVMVKP